MLAVEGDFLNEAGSRFWGMGASSPRLTALGLPSTAEELPTAFPAPWAASRDAGDAPSSMALTPLVRSLAVREVSGGGTAA